MDLNDYKQSCPFDLDAFQVEAISHLSVGRSVLVSAPTGSGKTVIAEYALQSALERGCKFFYTTPLKALSNQKFRDFSSDYPEIKVGLLTGDNSINGDAPLVVMTTEVLRNMIYEGSELLDELGGVVLDEVHYIDDPFRGQIWEEIIIHLPEEVKIVALSATVSNAREIGDWMNSLRGDIEVVISGERPVKLNNYYFVGNALVSLFSKKLFRVMNDQLERAKKQRLANRGGRGGRKPLGLRPKRLAVIRELKKRDMLPAIYFLFSRAACDDSAFIYLKDGVKLTSDQEAEEIERYLDEKISCLDEDDLDCLDYDILRNALKAGVAIHHSGVLPLFKEAVEELFVRGLLKVVFATETLSLGINMPARTVVIESLTKWGGDKHRPLTPGEYKQLTGRAGRRGIDEVGHAVVLYQNHFSYDQVRSLVKKEPNPVVSSYELSYNMAVNLLATRDFDEAQALLNLSFAQYEADKRVVSIESRMESLKNELEIEKDGCVCEEGGDALEYRELERKQNRLTEEHSRLTSAGVRRAAEEAFKSFKPGDVFIGGLNDNKVRAVVRKHKGAHGEGFLVVDSMGRYRRLSLDLVKEEPRIIGTVDAGKISSPTRKVRKSVGSKMQLLKQEAEEKLNKIQGGQKEQSLENSIEKIKSKREAHLCNSCQHLNRCMSAARRVERTVRSIESAKKERDSRFDVVSRKLVDVVDVLNELGFMEGHTVTPKGALLRRIYNECDLLLVETLEAGLLRDLSPCELAAFASWFIYESRESDSDRHWSERQEHLEGGLEDALEWLDGIYESLKIAEESRKLDLLGSIDIGFGEAAYRWCGGAELEDMLIDFPEWSIGQMVRTMKQIIDLLRQIQEVNEDEELRRKLGKAMDSIDRGVVGYSSIESIIEHEARGEMEITKDES
ncbi:MAG: DEAD/DEAH box helicase [Actinobacteria bacterium]|nr:DEAD/DEAH box helicase [Actinomycetota bacterium]